MSENHWSGFDKQLAAKAHDISNRLDLPPTKVNNLATELALEIRSNYPALQTALSAVQMPTSEDIFHEALSFQKGTDLVLKLNNPFTNRLQITAQNYICFVYLKDRVLKSIDGIFAFDSVANTFIKFLLGDDVRELRNAISHGDWRYCFEEGFDGLQYGTPTGVKRLSAKEYENMTQLVLCFIYVLAQEMQEKVLG